MNFPPRRSSGWFPSLGSVKSINEKLFRQGKKQNNFEITMTDLDEEENDETSYEQIESNKVILSYLKRNKWRYKKDENDSLFAHVAILSLSSISQ